MFEDNRHERSLILSLTDQDILKQSKLTDVCEINLISKLLLRRFIELG